MQIVHKIYPNDLIVFNLEFVKFKWASILEISYIWEALTK